METLFSTASARDIRVETLKDKLTRGIGSGWEEVLRNADTTLYKICEQLLTVKETICPSSDDVFNAFRECKYSTLKVVFVLQDPYHQVINGQRVADGLAMSCSYTQKLQPSLRLVYEEIERTVDKPVGFYKANPDLRHWANQGVLLFNTALTVAQAKPGSHTEIWRPFTQYLLSTLGVKDSLIWVFFGANAKSFSTFVQKGTKYHLLHPAAAAYRGGIWDSEDTFNNINYVLAKQGQTKIVW